MSTKIWIWSVLLMAFAGLTEAATCFSVYSNSNELIFQSRTSPIDLRNNSIGPEVEAKFPGGHFVFRERSEWCSEVTPDGLVRVRAEEVARGKSASVAAKSEASGISVVRQVVGGRPNDPASAETCKFLVSQHTADVLLHQQAFREDPALEKSLQNTLRVKMENFKPDGSVKKLTIAAINLYDQNLAKERINAQLMRACMSGSE